MGPYQLQITITEFQVVVAILLTAGGAFAAWLYRHERWFTNIVFPVIQALTGDDPRGTQVDSTDAGHFQETENRLQRIEDDIADIETQVEELQRRQNRHNQKTTAYLRRVVAKVEGVDLRDVDEPLFRGGEHVERENGSGDASGGASSGDD